jgi:hypothetical protein
MKQILIFTTIFASLVTSSCASPVEPTATSVPPTAVPTADPLPIVEAFLAAHNAHDAAAAGELLAEDAMFALPIRIQRHLHTEPIIGKNEITDYLVSDAWAAITIEGSNFQIEGNQILFNCKIFSNGALLGSGSITSNSACLIVVENNLVTFVGDQAEALLFLEAD